MNPVSFLISLMAGSVFTIGLGLYFLARGLRGIREQEFPFSDTQNLHGFAAQVAGGLMVGLGVLAIFSGIAVIAFGFWRIPQLLRGAR